MEHPDEPSQREYLETVLTKLLECGWIQDQGFGFHDSTGQYVFKWTAKGKERSKWVKEIESELSLGPKQMAALISLCHLHGGDE
jgi:hypothetical protein